MNREEQILIRRFHDLANTAYNRGICTFSDFLNLNEISNLNSIQKELSFVTISLYGGYREAERQIAVFAPDAFLPTINEYPISILKICPVNKKFAQDLSHRDFLGAILNLGIDRCKIGDILVKEATAYVFVHKSMETFLMEQLCRIKHTSVKVEPCFEAEDIRPSFAHIEGSVSSERLDAVMALAFQSSRNALSNLVAGEKVFVNGRLCYSNSQILRQGDIVSVRGYGKFIYQGFLSNTKKGRLFVALNKYI